MRSCLAQCRPTCMRTDVRHSFARPTALCRYKRDLYTSVRPPVGYRPLGLSASPVFPTIYLVRPSRATSCRRPVVVAVAAKSMQRRWLRLRPANLASNPRYKPHVHHLQRDVLDRGRAVVAWHPSGAPRTRSGAISMMDNTANTLPSWGAVSCHFAPLETILLTKPRVPAVCTIPSNLLDLFRNLPNPS